MILTRFGSVECDRIQYIIKHNICITNPNVQNNVDVIKIGRIR